MPKCQPLKFFRRGTGLRKDQLEFIAGVLDELRARFRTHADPIEAAGRRNCSIRLHCNLEPPSMQRIDQRSVQLQERFASGEYHKLISRSGSWLPGLFNSICQSCFGIEFAPVRAISSDEIRIAEFADSGGTVPFVA